MSRNSRARWIVAVSIVCLLARSDPATAGLILQDLSTGLTQINHGEPIGQSFTAIDAHVLFGFYYAPINPHTANSDPIELTLYEGAGTGGALLGASTFLLPTGFTGYHDVSFASIALDIGSQYTVVAAIDGESPYWGMRLYAVFGEDPYPGGQLVGRGELSSIGDARFRVIGVTVPIPSSSLLLAAGLAGLAWRRRTAQLGRERRFSI